MIAAVRLTMGRMRVARLKNDLIATVTHELKTPLSSMRVLVDTLMEGNYRDQQQVREYLELISKENLRLSRLIDNFLAFSRMERNKHAFEFEEVSIRDVVDEALEVLSERFSAPECRVGVDVPRDLPGVRADRNALVTVLTNLLDNAWKYTGDEKRIKVRAYTENGNVCLSVEDNGIGMSGRETRRIFERFYQGDQHLSRQASGCGLGLAIVRFILDAHQGEIRVESEPGEGSTFTVRLPAATENGVKEA
jgi:signal transduction histidine kinase